MSGELPTEINQAMAFFSLHEELWLNLSRTAAMMSHVMESRLRQHRLSLTQYNVLRILRAAPDGLCQFEIRDRLVAQVPDVPRILERMEKCGSIQRARAVTDRRMMIATLTGAGRNLVDELDAPMENWIRTLFEHLSGAEMEAMVQSLEKARTPHMGKPASPAARSVTSGVMASPLPYLRSS